MEIIAVLSVGMLLFLGCPVCEGATTTTRAPVTCSNTVCQATHYCQEISGGARCRVCDDACNGCTGFGPTRCKECQLGYGNDTSSSVCEVCDDACNGCTGSGPTRCKECQLGYGNVTSSRVCEACSNNTFGSGCYDQCHCPPGDNCSPINGLCDSNQCAVGWASAGCQNELPQLSSPPTVENLTCANATVVWLGWQKGADRGAQDLPIAQYELFLSYAALIGTTPDWTKVKDIPQNESLNEYRVFLQNLEPDAFYIFRVDVRQQDDDKLAKDIMAGKVSDEIFIPCTGTTTTTTTTTPKPSTTRPPGPYLLNNSQFVVTVFQNDPSIVQVDWAVLDDVANFTINVTLTYDLVKVLDVACPTEDNPTVTYLNVSDSGSYNITNLLPWRQYRINITAVSDEHNLTDTLEKLAETPDAFPDATVRNPQVSSVTKNSALVMWGAPQCSGRNGALLYYTIDVYELPNRTNVSQTDNTNTTFYEITTLVPYTNYTVSVVYVNTAGAGPMLTDLAAFTTTEDVPGPPEIVNVTADMTSITISLEEPTVSNGIVLEYQVSVAENEHFQSSFTRSFQKQGDDKFLTATMTSLQPDTLYYVKATASTSVGPGQPSPTRQVTTMQTVPKPPANVTSDETFRNESCVKLKWTHSDITNGHISGYTISYRERGASLAEQKSVSTNDTSVLVCDLLAGKYYDFMVSASNPAGLSDATLITLSTEQSDPPNPPLPEMINTTATSIGIALDPIVMTSTSYEYGYLLSIVEVNTVKKRAISSSNTTCPGIQDIPGTIIRNFTQAEIRHRTYFIIGDGKLYGDYASKPLAENHLYDVYYTITSYFEDVCKYAYVKTQSPIKTVEILGPPVAEDSSLNIALLIGIVVLVVIIIVVCSVVCYYLRCRRLEQTYKPYFNEMDDLDLKVYDTFDDYNAQKYWNTIHSIRESRYIVAGKEYLPESKQFTNGTMGIGNGGPVVLFNDEFSNLPHGRLSAFNAAKKRENELKNRFSHLLPYDHSRVILDPDANSGGDYINASFIKGYKHQRAYIASQSPFDEDTVLDFWRMIYQYEVRVIVMLSNIVEDNIVKCTQYWPDQGRVMYGQFVLDLVDVQEYADYTIRTIRVRTSTDKDWQMVHMFDMTSWPEHGVPDNSIPLLEMRRKINTYHNKHNTPIVVHCGTGVSRSGVYIAVDSLLQQYEHEGRISVYSFVRKMRKDRPAMVRTLKQYVFIYEAIFEAMVAGDTLTGPGDLKEVYQFLTRKNPLSKHSYLHGQFHCLKDFTRKLYPTMCSNACFPSNINKNRFCEIVPPDQYRPVLTTPGGFGRTDYVNAVYMDSHRKSCHYVITQTPLHTTVIDFWKLIYDHGIYTIVMMEPMTYDDDTCAEYWPEDHMKQYEPFFVETADVYQQENMTIRNLKLTSMSAPKDSRLIRQFQFNAWTDSEFIPKSKSMLLDVMDLVNDWQRVNNNDATPILVHCKDGATHSGLFIAMSVLCEKVLDEGEVDVFHTVKHLKRRRTQIVSMLDQYRFCYKALWDFINMRMPGGTLTDQMSKTQADKPYNSLNLASYYSEHDYMPY